VAISADPQAARTVLRSAREAALLHAACTPVSARTTDAVMHLLRQETTSQRRRVDRAVLRRLPRRRQLRGPRPLLWMAVAAAVVLAVLGLGWAGGWGGDRGPTLAVLRAGEASGSDGRPITAGAELGEGSKLVAISACSVELDDGSRLELDPGSAVALSNLDGRRVELSAGRADCSIRPQSGFPLMVTLPFSQITVLGTRFTTEVRPDADHVELQVGSVRLNHRTQAATLVLAPGQACLADHRGLRLEARDHIDVQAYELLTSGLATSLGVRAVPITDPTVPGGRCLALPAVGSGLEIPLPAQSAQLLVSWRTDSECETPFHILADGREIARIAGQRGDKSWRLERVPLPDGVTRISIVSLFDALPATKFERGMPYAVCVRLGRVAVVPRP